DKSAVNEGASEGSPQEIGQSAGSEMQVYLSGIIARINAQKKYPRSAHFNEQEGLVQILLEVAPDGRLIRTEVEKPCAFPVLNEAALDAVRAIGTLQPLPQSYSSKSVVLHVPIHFKIER
ncbi:MAG: energy transducer TonB, partial [Bdellovibrionales bacterium]|nr:energy transducer TonB [Bdellovibrionales bacterium]